MLLIFFNTFVSVKKEVPGNKRSQKFSIFIWIRESKDITLIT